MAWAYVGVFVAFDIATALVLMRRSPELLAERSKIQEGTKPWDKVLVRLVAGYLPIATWIAVGLDMRFGWSAYIPVGLQIVALAVTMLGYAIVVWAMASNPFFSTTVRIQKERGHTVATGGPYQFIRHPGYLGAILFTLAVPIMLGSLWALILAGLNASLYIVRTALEDKTLYNELSGYQDYASRVRYRLLPGIW